MDLTRRTADHQCIQKALDLYIPMPGAFSPDIVHLPANLLKIVKRIGVFREYLISVILDPQMRQINKPGVGCPPDPLLH